MVAKKLCEKNIITYSMISTFLGCRRKYQYRYVRGFTPIEKSDSLEFGSAIHAILEILFLNQKSGAKSTPDYYADLIRSDCRIRGLSDELTEKAAALMKRYAEHYSSDDKLFEVVDVEHEFEQPLTNPKSNYSSRHYRFCGKVDGIVRSRNDGKLYILEHKTASIVDDAYIQKIRFDTQISLYAAAITKELGEPVAGSIYDILIKPAIRKKVEETEDEFELRKAELLAKSKTGKTSAKRQLGETIEEFGRRCEEAVTDTNFRREIVLFDSGQVDEMLEELWAIAADIRTCKVFYKCTGNCSKFGICPFMTACRAGGKIEQFPELYTQSAPHEELSNKITDSFSEVF